MNWYERFRSWLGYEESFCLDTDCRGGSGSTVRGGSLKMEVDLYQRHGLYGLGDDTTPVTDQPIPAYLQGGLNTLNAGGFGGMSWSTIALLGIGTWFVMSALGRGTSRAYSAVTKPIKRRRKRRAELGEAEEAYKRRRSSIERAYSK